MSGRFVRASKYRHVHGDAAKKDKSFIGVRANYTGDGNFIKANNKYLCYSATGGGGPVVILNKDDLGRVDNPPTINVHKATVLDFDFSPFIDNLIATGGEDLYLNITNFPDDRKVDQATASFDGHQKKISLIHWHPTANNVVGSSAYDNTVKVWDVNKGCVLSYDFPDVPAFDWNYNGSLIGVSCKDKTVRIYDPRQPDAAQSAPGLPGKNFRMTFLDNHSKIIAFGASATGTRQYAVYDSKKFGDPLTVVDLDQNNGTLLPFYDPDTSVLFLGGKGDGMIRYYEVVDEEPYIHFLSEFRSNEAQKALTFGPKRSCDTKLCEIAIAYRLTGDVITPVSFQVPRKSDQFQEDLFPDTYAGVAMMEADEYFAGTNKDPTLVSMKPGTQSQQSVKADIKPTKSAAQLERELAEAHARIKELEAELAKFKA